MAGSIVINVSVLASLYFIHRSLPAFAKEMTLESIFTEEMPQEEITREVELDTAPAETLNVIAGGTPSTVVGASAQPAAAPVNVQKAAVMKEVNIRPVTTDVALPSDEMIGQELGEGEIVGEVGSMVEGYGAAMGIITQEIIRMMREQKVTLIWLFDESGSMEDDRKEIRENYLRVYEELGIATAQDEVLRRGSEPLLTVVASYGKDIHEHTLRPTADGDQIKAAIDKVVNDTS
ncbi:MAG: VWA domain-containing protein, partial [Fuerstia sp.]|nr:VWA domain-containing protein [Fuerstiella sp.]